jgi:hypothetical protein
MFLENSGTGDVRFTIRPVFHLQGGAMRLVMAAMMAFAVLTMTADLSNGAGASSGGKQARQTTTFGSLGIVSGQAIRVSAVREPYEDLEVKVCTVDLNFFDINGNRQATVIENLSPGKGSFLDLAWTDIAPPPSSARAQISAVVDVTSDAKDGKPGCHIATSVEVFNQTGGQTSTSDESFSLQEDHDLAPVGATAACWVECALADASCPAGYDCWQNPHNLKFLCCNGRPLQGWIPVN